MVCGQAFVWYNTKTFLFGFEAVVVCGQAFVWYNKKNTVEIPGTVVVCGQAFVWYNTAFFNRIETDGCGLRAGICLV